MDSLFHPIYETYTEEANRISDGFRKLIEPYISDLCKNYKIRELETIFQTELNIIFAMEALTKQHNIHLQKTADLKNITEEQFMDIPVSINDCYEKITIRETIKSNEKILAIKLFKKITGCGLKEAKDYIEKYFLTNEK